MHRRRFLASALATSALALTGKSEAQPSAGKPREYYELRKYFMQNGPQTKLTESYLSGALIPALNRLGMSPVGAFNLTIGPETPTLYVLIPSTSVEALVTADLIWPRISNSCRPPSRSGPPPQKSRLTFALKARC